MPDRTRLMTQPPTVFIVDPDAESQAQVAQIVKEMRIASKRFASAETFLESESAHLPGCLVTEFRLLGMNGIELQESLTADHITLPVIFVTSHPETSLIVRAMRNGAVTVLEKPFSGQELWDTIRQALSLDQSIRRIDARHDDNRRRLARLTPKERLVLDLLVKGKPNKAIAKQLGVSVRTVENRRQQIFKKTGADSVAQLVRLIIQATERDSV
jgi:FixJ family two-component response regulator